MNRFEATLLSQIRHRNDALGNGRVVVACSGGGDSTALLALLVSLRGSLGLELSMAHADHQLRAEAREDSQFVRELARYFDLDLAEARLDVVAHAAKERLGVETAARDLRWTWLRREADSCGADLIATGHTLEDHTETVFLRLSRGGGIGSLTPLPARQSHRWSPLIEARREELREYLRSEGLPWREDASNLTGFTPRNRWRALLPTLRRESPALDQHLWETHLQVRELSDLRDRLVEAWRGPRWNLDEDQHPTVRLRMEYWREDELRWVLEAAFRRSGWTREAALLRDLSGWAAPHLASRGRHHQFGHWALDPRKDEPLQWCLHPIERGPASMAGLN
ncbi:MAG: tRNA lysidine(34) synthetase TilS [Holophagaceae bacterium]|nr:tRNA lysidine(34) synthetase TilS [Holophagaceae bacterium]